MGGKLVFVDNFVGNYFCKELSIAEGITPIVHSYPTPTFGADHSTRCAVQNFIAEYVAMPRLAYGKGISGIGTAIAATSGLGDKSSRLFMRRFHSSN